MKRRRDGGMRRGVSPGPHTGGRAWRLAAAPLLLAGVALAGAGRAPVRNVDPEPTLAPVDARWPIYCPRGVTSTAGPAPGASVRDVPETVLRRFLDLHSAMRYEEAHAQAVRLVELAPGRPLPYYNLACALARLRRDAAALDALEQAVHCGWRDAAHAWIDPDLETLRRDPRFDVLLARMTELAAAEALVATPLRTDPWERVRDDLESRVPQILRRYHVPGATVALVRSGTRVWQGAFGEADAATHRPMRVDTLLPVAAPAHLLALIAAAQLEDAERLDLGDLLLRSEDLVDHERSGWAARAARRPEAGRSRTVSRASGRAEQWIGVPPPVSRRGSAAAARWPGASEFAGTMDLLRLAIEVACREPFARYCEEHILGPLEMSDTALETRGIAPERLSWGHTRLGTPLHHAGRDRAPGSLSVTRADDLALLLAALSTPSTPGEEPCIPEGVTAKVIGAGEYGLGRLGLGVQAGRTRDGMRAQVASVTDGAGCLMRWYPERGDGVVVLFNSETGPDAALRIAALALGGE